MNLPNIGPSKTLSHPQTSPKYMAALLGLALILAGGFSGPARAEEDNYQSALMDVFRVTEQDVTDALNSGVKKEELPIVFFIAQRGHLESLAVTGARSSGLSWMETAFHFHLNPSVFYTALTRPDDMEHTPLEKVYQAYRNPGGKIRLTDQEMVDLVNLKFLSEFYRRDPKEIMQKRSSGKTFGEINGEYWGHQGENSFQWDVDVPSGNPNPTPSATPGRHHHRGRSGGASGAPPSNQ